MRGLLIVAVSLFIGFGCSCESGSKSGNNPPGTSRSQSPSKKFDHDTFCRMVFAKRDVERILGRSDLEVGNQPGPMRPRSHSECNYKAPSDAELPFEVRMTVDCRPFGNVETLKTLMKTEAKRQNTEEIRDLELGKGGMYARGHLRGVRYHAVGFVHDQVACKVRVTTLFHEENKAEALAAHVYRVLDVSNAPL